MNRGISSRLNRLRNEPTLVTFGSFSILKTGLGESSLIRIADSRRFDSGASQ